MSKVIKNIWIVDDDKLYTLLLIKTFAKLNVCENITAYDNGKTAMDALKQNVAEEKAVPELIFLDINMSVMDGWEFIEEYAILKEGRNLNTAIYVASSSISTDDMIKARAHNDIHDYIVKPINSSMIMDIVDKVVS